MTSLPEKISAAAKALIFAAGATQAVMATDIVGQAQKLHEEYQNYTVQQISKKIETEIKQTYTPGVSGSV